MLLAIATVTPVMLPPGMNEHGMNSSDGQKVGISLWSD